MTSGNFQHPHIFLVGSSKSKKFTRPGGGGSETFVYPRNRKEHGQFILKRLEDLGKKIPAHNLDDMHAFDKNWNLSDDHGHGTEMAGLALYGDLMDLMAGTHSIQLTHCLESAKIFSPSIQTEPALYGDITIQTISRTEITAPQRKRIFSMAVTYPENNIDGQPSSWSSTIDQLCQDENGDNRLMVVSAGNVHPANLANYPQSNYEESVQDPAQSWNSLCVGAYTEKMIINPAEYPDWEPVAPIEDLSPYSTTSLTWQDQWPIKPDIVFEGGNCAYNPVAKDLDDNVDSLLLLTTYFKPTDKNFTTSCATSAATAQVARFAAMLQAKYLNFWPETIRALIVHSANWSSAMKSHFSEFSGKERVKKLLRCFGYGIPDISKALYSANHSLTLIAQDSLFPFKKEKSQCKTRDMNLHKLPWPSETLLALGELEVKMRVTLSYFIEPNPGRRGYRSKHNYASHGLRFDVKTAEESEAEFNIRINKAVRKKGTGAQSKSDSDKWDIGPTIRTRGSMHSDTWTGTAADLASKGYIAVFPIGGWWKERPVMDRWTNKARYSLIVSIETPKTDIDIYTPIENMINISIS
jgi:hypothetical protein